MNEREARTLIQEQSYRRGLLEEVKSMRNTLKFTLNNSASAHPPVDEDVRMYLLGVDNNLYLAEISLAKHISENE